jgi:triacylglycerol lipase
MKRHIFRIFVFSLVVGLMLNACGQIAPGKAKKTPVTYPYVFVHGLGGFGEDVSSPVDYWGSTAGKLLPALREEGFVCVAPSVGPNASAWDRACELYAAIAGVQVDYGAAHSAAHGHDRYGKTNAEPLAPGWGTADDNGNLRKINLIAHSFGGATARLMTALLQNGSAEEQRASQSDCSPLFTGGKGDWVFSLTCLASPHNGVSLLAMADVNPAIGWVGGLLGDNMIESALSSMGVSVGGKSFSDILSAAKTQDTAYYDLAIAGAKQVNRLAGAARNTYYFSFPVDGTNQGKATGDMSLPLRALAALIGNFTSEEYGVDEAWKPNDGLVNTVSATAPFEDPSKMLQNPAALTPAETSPGIWYIMPIQRGDHGSIIGMGRTMEETLAFYREQMKRIDALSLAQ